MAKGDAHDPKGLIFEAFRIPGITKSECRTIFLDWALSLPMGVPFDEEIRHVLGSYRDAHPDHPMIDVLTEGLEKTAAPRRRGGWRARPR
ncbi:MAG: hypothetical protein AB8B71_06525 [Paracoccaceae bacterium]